VIFLGQSLPMEDLSYFLKLFDNPIFVSYLTVKPDNVEDYIERFTKHISTKDKCQYWLLGRKVNEMLENHYKFPQHVKAFKNINQLTLNLKNE
jgi:hypothetical protein